MKKLSKRGLILKEIKGHMDGFASSVKELATLQPEDVNWVLTKVKDTGIYMGKTIDGLKDALEKVKDVADKMDDDE